MSLIISTKRWQYFQCLSMNVVADVTFWCCGRDVCEFLSHWRWHCHSNWCTIHIFSRWSKKVMIEICWIKTMWISCVRKKMLRTWHLLYFIFFIWVWKFHPLVSHQSFLMLEKGRSENKVYPSIFLCLKPKICLYHWRVTSTTHHLWDWYFNLMIRAWWFVNF